MLRLTLLVSCSVLLAGCTEQVPACENPDLVRREDGRCVRAPRDAGPRDAASRDGGDPDASNCDCATDEVCFEDRCVACNTDGDCTGEVCNTDTHDCVQCNSPSDCSPMEPTCDANRCTTGCETDLCADNFPTTPACNGTACVECTPDTESADCMGNSCDPNTFSCTTTPVGSLGLCEPCLRSSECGSHTEGGITASMICVDTVFGTPERSVGSYCLVEFIAGMVICPVGTPSASSGVAVDDPAAREVCLPRPMATCPALLDRGMCAGTDASTCGVPGETDSTCFGERCRARCDADERDLTCFHGEQCLPTVPDDGTAFCQPR